MFDRLKGMALILYNNTDFAQAAVRETKGWKIGGNKIKVVAGAHFPLASDQFKARKGIASCTCCFRYVLVRCRLISPVRRAKWHSIALCRHQGRICVTSMKSPLIEGNCL